MLGIEIKETFPTDFARIYPLLQTFDSPYSREDWQRIFNYRWDGGKEFIGFHLEHQGEVVGFMGLIFSCRYKDNKKYEFCNITSWIVKENYRSATLLFIRKLKQFENTIFTGLRPIIESHRLLTMVGFQSYETHYRIIPTLSACFNRTQNISAHEGLSLLNQLNGENKRIAEDHATLNCKSLLFDLNGEHCLLIYHITQQKKYLLTTHKIHLLYISDTTLFNANIRPILKSFKNKLGLFSALYVDNRFVTPSKSLLSLKKEIFPPRICYSQHPHEIAIDELYSEAVLL